MTFDHMLATHCSPALAGIRPANLVACGKADYPNFLQLVGEYNCQLNSRGIHFMPLVENKKNHLLLVFRPDKLQHFLQGKEAREMLMSAGYPIEGDLFGLLSHLKKRIFQEADFPHEIGLFLGYPPQDVHVFLQNKGKAFLLCGHWKVYDNKKQAQQLFDRYDRCRSLVLSRIVKGQSIIQIFQAV